MNNQPYEKLKELKESSQPDAEEKTASKKLQTNEPKLKKIPKITKQKDKPGTSSDISESGQADRNIAQEQKKQKVEAQKLNAKLKTFDEVLPRDKQRKAIKTTPQNKDPKNIKPDEPEASFTASAETNRILSKNKISDSKKDTEKLTKENIVKSSLKKSLETTSAFEKSDKNSSEKTSQHTKKSEVKKQVAKDLDLIDLKSFDPSAKFDTIKRESSFEQPSASTKPSKASEKKKTEEKPKDESERFFIPVESASKQEKVKRKETEITVVSKPSEKHKSKHMTQKSDEPSQESAAPTKIKTARAGTDKLTASSFRSDAPSQEPIFLSSGSVSSIPANFHPKGSVPSLLLDLKNSPDILKSLTSKPMRLDKIELANLSQIGGQKSSAESSSFSKVQVRRPPTVSDAFMHSRPDPKLKGPANDDRMRQRSTVMQQLMQQHMLSKKEPPPGTRKSHTENSRASLTSRSSRSLKSPRSSTESLGKQASLTSHGSASTNIRIAKDRFNLLKRLAGFVHEDKFLNDDEHLMYIRTVKRKTTVEIPESLIASIKLEVFPILVDTLRHYKLDLGKNHKLTVELETRLREMRKEMTNVIVKES